MDISIRSHSKFEKVKFGAPGVRVGYVFIIPSPSLQRRSYFKSWSQVRTPRTGMRKLSSDTSVPLKNKYEYHIKWELYFNIQYSQNIYNTYANEYSCFVFEHFLRGRHNSTRSGGQVRSTIACQSVICCISLLFFNEAGMMWGFVD